MTPFHHVTHTSCFCEVTWLSSIIFLQTFAFACLLVKWQASLRLLVSACLWFGQSCHKYTWKGFLFYPWQSAVVVSIDCRRIRAVFTLFLLSFAFFTTILGAPTLGQCFKLSREVHWEVMRVTWKFVICFQKLWRSPTFRMVSIIQFCSQVIYLNVHLLVDIVTNDQF